jgi:SAM-dependent methyltransferase
MILPDVTLDEFKRRQSELWGSAPWERLATTMHDVYAELVRVLAPSPGERWLDLATGTGAVAIEAARAGADVTGQDLAQGMIATARRLAREAGVAVRFEVGDVESLPYADASFDIISSAFGVTFARDHFAVAHELARVCRPGGRIGLTDWQTRRHTEFEEMLSRFIPTGSAEARSHDWGRNDHVVGLLGRDFELEFIEGDSPWRGVSGEAIWQDYVESNGQARAWVTGLPAGRMERLRGAWIAYFERHRTADGISAPREYVLMHGRRRASSLAGGGATGR